jgi:putative PIN family toxin of toxin-antitoxin system
MLSAKGASAAVLDAAIDRRFEMLCSYHLLEELADVLRRPRISQKYAVSPVRMAGLLELLEIADVVPGVPGRSFVPDDPDDDWLVACAIEGAADFVVTEDRLLLDMRESEGVAFVTAADFLALLRSQA